MKNLKRSTLFLLYSVLSIVFTACNIQATSTSSTAMLTVRESTNCRVGPGTNYEIVFTYPSGTKLPIIGRDESANFWLVKSDKSPAGNCWMWGGSVDVTGNDQAVTNVTPVSTSTGASNAAAPKAPSLQKWDYSCSNGTLTFTVTWKDRATDETGYRIFRNGEQIAELPADSITYTDTLPANQSLEYYVQVFGPGGAANSSVMKASC